MGNSFIYWTFKKQDSSSHELKTLYIDNTASNSCIKNSELNIQCCDNVNRLAVICGAFLKEGLSRYFQDDKVDVIFKYTANEAFSLKKYGDLSENTKVNEGEILCVEEEE
ncbi:hypothetical protein PIROE2DRAFT_17325, partial [Piromyces sp. E2]